MWGDSQPSQTRSPRAELTSLGLSTNRGTLKLTRYNQHTDEAISMTEDHAGVFVPPPLIFALPLFAAIFMQSRSPWPIVSRNESALVVAGLFAVAAAVSIGLASVISFRNARTTVLPMGRPTTTIVARGPYRFTRNPMYLAMAVGYLGVSLLLNNVWAIVLLPVVLFAVDRFVIRREERYLAAKFGEDYRSYCARVRRWI